MLRTSTALELCSDVDSWTKGVALDRRLRSQDTMAPRWAQFRGCFFGELFACLVMFAPRGMDDQSHEGLHGKYLSVTGPNMGPCAFLLSTQCVASALQELSCPPSLFHMVGASRPFSSTLLSKALVLRLG